MGRNVSDRKRDAYDFLVGLEERLNSSLPEPGWKPGHYRSGCSVPWLMQACR